MKTNYYYILLLACIITKCTLPPSAKANNLDSLSADSLQLVKLYNATDGDNWTSNAGWLSEEPVVDWHGITLSDDGCHVTRIYLGNNNLTDTIPNLNLPELTHLYLYSNKFEDTIPNFSGLPKLTHLYLYGNELKGGIPDFNNLPKLTHLYLQDNQLGDTILIENNIPNFNNLPELTHLYLQENDLNGEIPNFDKLPELTHLYLQKNKLTGEIPNFDKLPKLVDLSLNSNKLTGTIPNVKIPKLTHLYLQDNDLSGEIPNFDSLPNLVFLHLRFNELSGAIPNFDLPSLTHLYLQDNQLSDSIPNFSGLPNLTHLYLEWNQLSDSIPNFDHLPNLVDLRLRSNQLTGMIPNFENLDNLTYLLLNHNQLSGSIPDVFRTSNIKILYLNNNQLSGPIPHFTEITDLRLEYNRFTFEGLAENVEAITSDRCPYAVCLYYVPQATIPIHLDTSTQTLYVEAGGTLSHNTYTWFKDGEKIEQIVGDSTLIVRDSTLIVGDSTLTILKKGTYCCEISNSDCTIDSIPQQNLILKSKEITIFNCMNGNSMTNIGDNCDDGNRCTTSDEIKEDCSCKGTPLDCDDNDDCTNDFCDEENGSCQNVPMICDDGIACTDDTCVSGNCVFTPNDTNCDDGDPCTEDICDPFSSLEGCKNEEIFCECMNDSDCDDGNVCNGIETCDDGVCNSGISLSCDDGNPCTVDYCEEENGSCQNIARTCDDGNPCTVDYCEEENGSCKNEAKNINVEISASETTVCPGSITTLTAKSNNSFSFQWNTEQTDSIITVNPTETTTYRVTVSDEDGCNNIAEIEIKVHQLPTIDAGDDRTICKQEPTTLTANSNGYFKWSHGATTSETEVRPTETTTYHVTVTNNGCEITDSVKVTVADSVKVKVVSIDEDEDNNIFICRGDNSILTALGIGTFKWIGKDIIGETDSAVITVSPKEATSYTVTMTDSLGCTGTNEVTVNVYESDTVKINTIDIPTICPGEEVSLSAGIKGSEFEWTDGQNNFINNGSKIDVLPMQTTTYTVTRTDDRGCKTADSITVEVYEPPHNPQIILKKENSDTLGVLICTLDSTIVEYQWKKNGVLIEGAIYQFIFIADVSDAFNYSVQLIYKNDNNDCNESVYEINYQGKQLQFESEPTTEIQLYPNPTQGYLNLSISNPKQETVQWQIFNILGQSIYQQKLEPTINSQTSFTFDKLTKGIFLVIVEIGSIKYTERVILY